MTAAILLSCLYGYDASHPFDELVYLVETAVDKVCEAASTSNFYVNTIPWLKYVPSWLPGAGWKRQANAWRVEKDKLQNDPFEWTKLRMAAGTATPSVVKSLLTQVVNGQFTEQRAEEEEDMIKWAAGTLYAAGAETTIASLTTLVLAMVLYPEVQKKIQVELDSVLGEDRLPELSDRESLPYLNCTIKEALRWGSPLPLALPHVCTEEDIYKEYRIPKGAIVMGNIWAISHDASVYPEPQIFNPDRFLDPSTPSPLTFGFGRRICPGSHFAESGMFIAIATLLAIFNITSSPGKSAPEAKTCMNRLVLHPAQFNCTVIPRSEKHKRLLEEWVEA
ncbi:hypothetical protein FRC09_001047 [Ceratobasidium sp. 395]|nr:hypothetical protein FRC09_001047 [Ceratobasidium sp. 395]